MQADSFGSPTTTTADEALAGINDFAEGLIAYQPRSANVLIAADEHPESALANIYAGILWMFLESPEAPAKSMPYRKRAEDAGAMNHREQGLLALLKAWQTYDYRRVRTVTDELIKDYINDLPTLKIALYHAFNAGDARHMLQLSLQGQANNPHAAPVHSMVAFGYEQLDQLDEAERAAHNALQIDANEPWAHHALAHIHLGRGTTREGLRILAQSAPSWEGLNSFMFTHNWWHVALFELAHGDLDNALSIYDKRCWGIQPDYSQDQIGAVSLLVRLELAGVDVGDRWQQLLPYLQSRTVDVIQPFLSLQYLYGLARADSTAADELMSLIEDQAERPAVVQDHKLWLEVGIPAARGLVAHARDQYESAVRELSTVRKHLWRIGGSHAQRDLFDQLLLDARLKSGHWADARKTLEQRMRYEPESPILASRLNEVYAHLDLS
jgi:tetratricopeptide (TPR) repeat protein